MDYTKLNVTTIDAILSLNANAKVGVTNEDDGTYTIEWFDGTAVISNANIDAEVTRLETEWTNHAYQRNRKAKYMALNQDEMRYSWEFNDNYVIFNPMQSESEIKEKYPGIKKVENVSEFSSNVAEKISIDKLKELISASGLL